MTLADDRFVTEQKNGRPIEVSEYVRPGKNTARIIQLGNMEDRLFILFAAVPPEDEVKIYIERTTRKMHSESGKLIEQPSTRPAKSAEECS